MTTLRLALTGFFCLGILCCCSTKKDSKPADAPDSAHKAPPASSTAPASAPEDFSCRVGSGGGITGLWSGYTMEPGGAVLSWEGRIAGENPTPAGHLDPDEINRLWQLVQDARFQTLQSDSRGNMTFLIEVTAAGGTHTAWWAAEGVPKSPGLHGTLTDLRAELLAILSKASTDIR